MVLNDAHRLLASAVLERAVEDWRILIQKKAWEYEPSKNRSDPIPNKYCNFDELRAFFKSAWCEALCEMVSENVCKETILNLLEAELKEAQEKELTEAI